MVSSSRLYRFAFVWKDLYQSAQLGVPGRSSDSTREQPELDVGVSSWVRLLSMLSDFRFVVVGTVWALSLSGPAICSPCSIRATSYPIWLGGGVLCGQAGPVAGLCNYL